MCVGLKFLATRLAVALGLGLSLAACGKVDWDSFRMPGFSSSDRQTAMAAPVRVGVHDPVKPEDLMDAQGQCAGGPMAAVPPTPGADSGTTDPVTVPPNAALGSTGISLGMTECDVVKRSGSPEKIDFGTNERSERTVVLTYTKTMRPGIYSFAAGRLVTIDRAPEPPPQARPARPAKPPAKPKPKPAAT